jgi:AcrR family transcriptional regulator
MARQTQRTRTNYHHGDLRAALVRAGAELARTGGLDAVVLRGVTRVVGVAPNAVYTHFGTLAELKAAVADFALYEMAAAIQEHLASVAEPADPQQAARLHLAEVGRAYVHFALAEPGLFRTAMDDNPDCFGFPDDFEQGPGDRVKPDALLMAALERMTDAGCLAPEQTIPAAVACWATVHGLATILLNLQPMRTDEEREAAIDASLRILMAGLAAQA